MHTISLLFISILMVIPNPYSWYATCSYYLLLYGSIVSYRRAHHKLTFVLTLTNITMGAQRNFCCSHCFAVFRFIQQFLDMPKSQLSQRLSLVQFSARCQTTSCITGSFSHPGNSFTRRGRSKSTWSVSAHPSRFHRIFVSSAIPYRVPTDGIQNPFKRQRHLASGLSFPQFFWPRAEGIRQSR